MAIHTSLGTPTADSYVSVASANSYFDALEDNTSWDSIDSTGTLSKTARRENLLKQATREVDRTYRFFDDKYNQGIKGQDTYQALEFPRSGNIDADNIATGAITSVDIADSVSPLKRDFYNIGEWVYSGLIIPTSADLNSTTTAGTAFIANDGDSTLHLVTTAATAKTYTASKDTYVYLDYQGAFTYVPFFKPGHN